MNMITVSHNSTVTFAVQVRGQLERENQRQRNQMVKQWSQKSHQHRHCHYLKYCQSHLRQLWYVFWLYLFLVIDIHFLLSSAVASRFMTSWSVCSWSVWWMFLLVPAHPDCPGQNPKSRKTVCVCVCVGWCERLADMPGHYGGHTRPQVVDRGMPSRSGTRG